MIVLVCLMLVKSSFAQNDAINNFFKQYQENPDFTVISISPKMFKMISKVKWENVEQPVKDMISQLSSFRMLTTEKNGTSFYNDALKKLNVREYEELMTVRDKNENIRFLIKESGNMVNELVMLLGSDTDFMLMSLTGNIDLDNISKLGQTVNIKGMEKIEKVEKKPK